MPKRAKLTLFDHWQSRESTNILAKASDRFLERPEQIAADKNPYYDALEATDLHWKEEVLDLGDLETLLDACLAKQLLSTYEDAQNPETSVAQDRKFH